MDDELWVSRNTAKKGNCLFFLKKIKKEKRIIIIIILKINIYLLFWSCNYTFFMLIGFL